MGAFVAFACLAVLMEVLVRLLRHCARDDPSVFVQVDGPPFWKQMLGKRDRRLFWFVSKGKFLGLESLRLRVLCGAIFVVGLTQIVVGALFVSGILGLL